MIDPNYLFAAGLFLSAFSILALWYVSLSPKRFGQMLEQQVRVASGGKFPTLSSLATAATKESALREETPIAVYGDEILLAELRRGRFFAAVSHSHAPANCRIAVIDPEFVDDEVISEIKEVYVVVTNIVIPQAWGDIIPSPELKLFDSARSGPNLEARLMDAIRHRDARKPRRSA